MFFNCRRISILHGNLRNTPWKWLMARKVFIDNRKNYEKLENYWKIAADDNQVGMSHAWCACLRIIDATLKPLQEWNRCFCLRTVNREWNIGFAFNPFLRIENVWSIRAGDIFSQLDMDIHENDLAKTAIVKSMNHRKQQNGHLSLFRTTFKILWFQSHFKFVADLAKSHNYSLVLLFLNKRNLLNKNLASSRLFDFALPLKMLTEIP